MQAIQIIIAIVIVAYALYILYTRLMPVKVRKRLYQFSGSVFHSKKLKEKAIAIQSSSCGACSGGSCCTSSKK